jgi:uridine kinase
MPPLCGRRTYRGRVPVPVRTPQLLDRVAELTVTRARRPLFIGIDGRGGAGKSTLARRITACLSRSVIVAIDDFTRPERPGWDCDRLERQVLAPLRTGRPGRYQRWDWDRDEGAEWLDVPVDSVVIVEGVSSTRAEVRVDWDLTVWVETPRVLCLQRGVERDGEHMRHQWTSVWMPQEDSYIREQRPHLRVDFVVAGC